MLRVRTHELRVERTHLKVARLHKALGRVLVLELCAYETWACKKGRGSCSDRGRHDARDAIEGRLTRRAVRDVARSCRHAIPRASRATL